MRKKKHRMRWLILTAALALLFAMLPSYAADDELYFTGVNDELKDLSDATMPFYYREQFYMPYTIFADKSLGVYYSYNKDIYRLTFYNKDNTLEFDLRMDFAYANGQQFHETVYYKNGTPYVPIEFVCKMFGLVFTDINAAPLHILRVASNTNLDSTEFREKNRDRIVSEYRKYMGLLTPSPSPSTATPSPRPSEEGDRFPVVLTFDCASGEGLAEIIDALDRYESKAVFFLTADAIRAEPDAVRRMIVDGHTVGLLVPDTGADGSAWTAETILEQIRDTNRTLDDYTYAKTLLIRFSSGSAGKGIGAGLREAVREKGYVWWDWTMDTTKYSASSASRFVTQAISALEKADDRAVIRIRVSEFTSGALPQVLEQLDSEGYPLRTISLEEKPVRLME